VHLQLHFSLQSEALLGMLQRWLREAGKDKPRLEEHVRQVGGAVEHW
jgi:hypothetical protein